MRDMSESMRDMSEGHVSCVAREPPTQCENERQNRHVRMNHHVRMGGDRRDSRLSSVSGAGGAVSRLSLVLELEVLTSLSPCVSIVLE